MHESTSIDILLDVKESHKLGMLRESLRQDTAGVYWMNPSTEKSRLIAERQGRKSAETTGSLIHHQGDVDLENLSPRSLETARQKKVREEERACYDAAPLISVCFIHI